MPRRHSGCGRPDRGASGRWRTPSGRFAPGCASSTGPPGCLRRSPSPGGGGGNSSGRYDGADGSVSRAVSASIRPYAGSSIARLTSISSRFRVACTQTGRNVWGSFSRQRTTCRCSRDQCGLAPRGATKITKCSKVTKAGGRQQGNGPSTKLSSSLSLGPSLRAEGRASNGQQATGIRNSGIGSVSFGRYQCLTTPALRSLRLPGLSLVEGCGKSAFRTLPIFVGFPASPASKAELAAMVCRSATARPSGTRESSQAL